MRYDDILRNSNIEFQFDLPRLPVPVVLSDPDFLMFAELSANLVLQHMNLSVSTAVCLSGQTSGSTSHDQTSRAFG